MHSVDDEFLLLSRGGRTAPGLPRRLEERAALRAPTQRDLTVRAALAATRPPPRRRWPFRRLARRPLRRLARRPAP